MDNQNNPLVNNKIRVSRGYTVGLYFLTLIIGICSLAYEYTFSKLSSDLLGASHIQWALTIGVMLLAMGIGADFQKRFSDKKLMSAFFLSEIFLALVGGWGPVVLFYIFGISRDYYPFSQYFFTFIIGFIVGMEVPLLIRLNQKYSNSLKINLAHIFRLDYWGGFLGSLFWLFLFIGFWDTILQVGFSLALLNLLGLAIALIIFKSYYSRKKLFWNILFLSVLLEIGGLFYVPRLIPHLEQNLFREPIVFSKSTPYQHLVLTKSRAGTISLYINGHLQFNSRDEYIYHEYLVHPAMSLLKNKESILILGGGDGLALREVLKYPTVKNVVLVDIDPAITKLAKTNPFLKKLNENSLKNSEVVTLANHGFFLKEGKDTIIIPNQNKVFSSKDQTGESLTVQVLNVDAYKVARSIAGKYDLIILDFPDPHDVELSKLYSLSFYSFLKKKLKEGGLLVQQASSPFYAQKSFLLIGRTLKQAGFKSIPFKGAVPSFGIWGWYLAYPNYASSSKGDKFHIKFSSTLKEVKLENPRIKYLTSDLVKNAFHFPKNFFKDQENNYNTILNNLLYRYYITSLKNY